MTMMQKISVAGIVVTDTNDFTMTSNRRRKRRCSGTSTSEYDERATAISRQTSVGWWKLSTNALFLVLLAGCSSLAFGDELLPLNDDSPTDDLYYYYDSEANSTIYNATTSWNEGNTTNVPTIAPTATTYKYVKTQVPTAAPSSDNSTWASMAPTVASDRQGAENDNIVFTLAPTANVTFNYTGNATMNETNVPTTTPYDVDTNAPTIRQSDAQISTPEPTPRPPTTPRPTTRPPTTPQPTTRNPTNFPTTLAPTLSPTLYPTTADPTSEPTPSPTPLPTSQPSAAPSISPTSRPSVSPSGGPTKPPSIPPSAAPTPETPKPTVSAQPSDLPSAIPSRVPSSLPSDFPSDIPSAVPSPEPSSSPSQRPSLSLQSLDARVKMTLNYSDRLQSLSIITWEKATSSHIRESMVRANIEPALLDLRVYTNIIRQMTGAQSSGATTNATQAPSTVRRRRAQAENQQNDDIPLTIAFDTAIEFRADNAYIQDDVETWISYAFDTSEDRDAYIERLKRTGDLAFERIVEIDSVNVGGVEVPEEDEVTDGGSGSSDMTMMFLIIGLSVGGGALLLLILFFVVRYYLAQKQMPSTKAESSASATQQNGGVTTEIVVEHNNDEVSTLGDPLWSGGAGGMMIQHLEKDERTASVTDDYDYKYLKQHHINQNGEAGPTQNANASGDMMTGESSGRTDGLSNLGLSQLGESLFSDDASFEEQFSEAPEQAVPFEVTVPAGKLGMVIDTPNGGFPIVHAIKDTSILADRVRVGDRLVSVDGQDCSSMTAVQVSKLISLRSEQASRVLVFVRQRIPR